MANKNQRHETTKQAARPMAHPAESLGFFRLNPTGFPTSCSGAAVQMPETLRGWVQLHETKIGAETACRAWSDAVFVGSDRWLMPLFTPEQQSLAQAWISDDKKSARIAGRVSQSLLDAVREKTGLTSDSEIIAAALTRVALDDDFGRKLLSRAGTIPEDVKLAIED